MKMGYLPNALPPLLQPHKFMEAITEINIMNSEEDD